MWAAQLRRPSPSTPGQLVFLFPPPRRFRFFCQDFLFSSRPLIALQALVLKDIFHASYTVGTVFTDWSELSDCLRIFIDRVLTHKMT